MAELSASDWNDINRHYFGEILSYPVERATRGSKMITEQTRFYRWPGEEAGTVVTAKEITARLLGSDHIDHTLTISKPIEHAWLDTIIYFDPHAEKILSKQKKVYDPRQQETTARQIASILKVRRIKSTGLLRLEQDDYDTLHWEIQRGANFKLWGL